MNVSDDLRKCSYNADLSVGTEQRTPLLLEHAHAHTTERVRARPNVSSISLSGRSMRHFFFLSCTFLYLPNCPQRAGVSSVFRK